MEIAVTETTSGLGRSRVRSDGWTDYRVRLLRALRLGLRATLLQAGTAQREAGDFVRLRIGPLRLFLVSDPEAIRYVVVTNQRNYARGEPAWSNLRRVVGNGILTSDGELHRRQRRLMQPLFHPQRIAAHVRSVQRFGEELCARWHAQSGNVLDVHEEMMHVTMLVIGSVLFSLDLRDRAEVLGRAVSEANRFTTQLDPSLGGYLGFLPTRAIRRLRRAVRELDALVYGLIAERRREPLEREDLLSLLLQARDDEAAPGSGMTDRQVRDEAVTLFAAGHETTANLLSWTWLLLSQHPEAEASLHAELDRELGGRIPEFEDLPRLPYTEKVLRESMRLFPPAWANARVALEADQIQGRPVPAGAIVAFLPWIVHRDPRWYPMPERFDPERFATEVAATRPRFAYFPFGGGARQCIGQSFAEMEAKILLATLAQRFTPRAAEERRVEPEPMVTLRPKGGLPMRILARG